MRNFRVFSAKKTPPWNKYTTAVAGGTDLYELCLGLDYLVDIIL